jgi:predicted NodU family carbamoyl transferase
MAWTYDATIPTNRDAVRFAIGDTDPTDPQTQDGELDYLLIQQPYVLSAAATACSRLAAKYARKVNDRDQDRSVNWSDLAKHYSDLGTQLRQDILNSAVGSTSLIYAGGLSANEHFNDSITTDLMQPAFTKDPFVEPGTEMTSGGQAAAFDDPFFNP